MRNDRIPMLAENCDNDRLTIFHQHRTLLFSIVTNPEKLAHLDSLPEAPC
jgi:hypothetical protein